MACLRVGRRSDDVDADERVRSIELARRREAVAVDPQRLVERLRREVRREAERQPELRGQLRPEQAGAEDLQRDVRARSRHGLDALPGLYRRQVRLQLEDVLREVVGCQRVATQRLQRQLIGAGRPPQPEIDAAGEQRLERAELFGDDVRRVVGQHDATCADANGARARGNVRDHQRGGRSRYRRGVVMLRHPEAAIAESLGVLRDCPGLIEGRTTVGALLDPTEFENRHRNRRGIAHYITVSSIAVRCLGDWERDHCFART